MGGSFFLLDIKMSLAMVAARRLASARRPAHVAVMTRHFCAGASSGSSGSGDKKQEKTEGAEGGAEGEEGETRKDIGNPITFANPCAGPTVDSSMNDKWRWVYPVG